MLPSAPMNDIVSSVQALVLKQQEWELLAEHLQPLIMGVFKQNRL